jgi:ATP-dependent Clp protease ATP-binding subunit ClpA
LADRDVTFELTAAARTWLGNKGYDKLYGARPLARVIQEHIKKPLAEELLFGKLTKGGLVKVKIDDKKLAFDIVKPSSGKTKPPSKNTEMVK